MLRECLRFLSSFAAGAPLLLLAACACNDVVVGGRLDRYENATSRIVVVDITGFDLVNMRDNHQISVGRSVREFIFARHDSTARESVRDWKSLVSDFRAPIRRVRHFSSSPFRADKLVAVVERRWGAGAEVSETHLGINLGFRRSSAVVIPRDFNGIVLLARDGAASGYYYAVCEELHDAPVP
jgi:hypothetical protein